jgi:Uma2 family endonuclease
MTADEFFDRSAELGRCELIEGEIIQMSPSGGLHGLIGMRMLRHLDRYVQAHDLGELTLAETGFRLGQDTHTVRAPDIALIASDRVEQAKTEKFIPIPPDLAVEVNSPSDAIGDVVAKVQWWLAHCTRAVWVVDPKSQTVTTYHPDGSARVVHLNETLTGGDVLPGFELPLDKLFVDQTDTAK